MSTQVRSALHMNARKLSLAGAKQYRIERKAGPERHRDDVLTGKYVVAIRQFLEDKQRGR